MKGLDTPVLLDILWGAPAAKTLLHELRESEIATTELNMVELLELAKVGRPGTLQRRLLQLAHLRRRLTVLPIDELAVDSLAREWNAVQRFSPATRLILASLVAHGCEEVFTTREAGAPGSFARLRLVEYPKAKSKKRR